MNITEVERALADSDVVPCVEGPITAAKQTLEACWAADIPALLSGSEGCGQAGCSGKSCGCSGCGRVQVLVREIDVPRVAELLRSEWMASIHREGIAPLATAASSDPQSEGAAEVEDPPCPACGTAAPLKDGACTDCGLQLE